MIKMQIKNNELENAKPRAQAVAGCKESPFELGWADGNWTRAAFAVKGTAVELTLAPTSAGDASVLSAPTEVRYAWEGYPQCVLCAWQPDFAGLSFV